MTRKPVTNLAASIFQQLRNKARERGEPVDFILTIYGNERFIYRLGKSEFANRFFLKGAMLFLVWTGDFYRPTRDMDFLAFGSNDVDSVENIVKQVCRVSCPEDGLSFIEDSIRGEIIKHDAEYNGIRVKFVAILGRTRIPLQIDIGFGDAVVPKSKIEEIPTILDLPEPKIGVYPREVLISEKYEAMVELGLFNSRMKDFYDIWALANEFEFDGPTLCRSISATFKRRKTDLPGMEAVPFATDFYKDKDLNDRWKAFLKKQELKRQPGELETVLGALKEFLSPPTQSLIHSEKFAKVWAPGGPWRDK